MTDLSCQGATMHGSDLLPGTWSPNAAYLVYHFIPKEYYWQVSESASKTCRSLLWTSYMGHESQIHHISILHVVTYM